jgi:hypothetical protein
MEVCMNYANTYNGLKIVKSHLIEEFTPKLQLSTKVDVTDEFRSSFNQWLIDMFGTERKAFVFGNTMFMHPNNYTKLVMDAKAQKAQCD